MRRYGRADYGGATNAYPLKQQPAAFTEFPPRRTDVRHLTPPDLQPRQPARAMDLPPVIAEAPGGGFDMERFMREFFNRARTDFHGYNAYDPMRYGNFRNVALFIGTQDTIVLEKATDVRIYLFVVNTHPVNDLFLTFQTTATATLGVPISPNRGFYEHIAPVPQDAVHLIGSAAGTTGVLVFAERDPSILNRQPGPV